MEFIEFQVTVSTTYLAYMLLQILRRKAVVLALTTNQSTLVVAGIVEDVFVKAISA